MTQYYAVLDTNVLVSYLYTKDTKSPTRRVVAEALDGRIIPLYHQDILAEYEDVLHRDKFSFDDDKVRKLIDSIIGQGIEVFPQPTGEILIDMDDLVFYEVAMEKRDDDAYLVTGNMKHYPVKDFIVTPAEMMEIIERGNQVEDSPAPDDMEHTNTNEPKESETPKCT